MIRPEKIWLEEPIQLEGVSIRHTEEGLRYLVEHYTKSLPPPGDKRITDSDRQHGLSLIDNYKNQILIYERSKQ